MCCEVQNDDSNKETLLSSNAKLYQISAIAIGPDGIVYVADQGTTLRLPFLQRRVLVSN